MVDFGLLAGAIHLAVIINDISRSAQANKVSCLAMNGRIQIANDIIKTAFETHKNNPKALVISDTAFKTYFQLLERMRDFVAEISKRKTFSKLFYALRYRDEFDALLRDFDSCVLDLNLGIALRTQAQLETDRSALEEDMVELRAFRKELQSGVDCLGGQLMGIRQMIATNRPMDDILTVVEIDYHQILSITPGETREGRTFPVHKRSWLAQEVAEKPLGFFGSQDMLDMLKSEIAIMKKLDRSNYIAKFMGVTNRNNNISIIMEWLPGGDLATALSKTDMDWETKLFIAADITRGLHFLHEVGIIHKTLRAKNILLTRHGQAKITNFRQSRLESAQTRPMSDPFSFVRWLAPEKMTHKDVRYGAECDIYSFGMLLFEIASNRIPFVKYKDRDLPELIVLRSLYETVPEGTPLKFSNIMTACWSHDPRLRPTVSQVLLILRSASSDITDGQERFGGLPSNMGSPAPLFAMSPPTPLVSGAFPLSPPMTPSPSGAQGTPGLLTSDIWNNPYVNKRYVEEELEELKQAQQKQGQQQSPRPQNQSVTQASQPTQSSGQPTQSSGQPIQSSGSKHELAIPAAGDASSAAHAAQAARPQHQTTSFTHGANPTPINVTFPVDPRASPSAGPASAGSGSLAPNVNRNTRPQVVRARPSQPLETEMSRLSMQNEDRSASPVTHDPNQPFSPQFVIRNIPIGNTHGSSNTNDTSGLEATRQKRGSMNNNSHPNHPNHPNNPNNPNNEINRNNSPTNNGNRDESASPTRPATVSIRPRSTSLTPGTPIGTLSQALQFHESHEREQAWGIFKAYSDQKNPEAMYWTGYYLFHGEGGQVKNRPKAFELFHAVTLLDPTPEMLRLAANAHFYTAVCYLEGEGVERNHVTGFGHMEMAADSGNAFAQYLVGDAYHKGSAVVQTNQQKRNHYWQLAALQKEPRAISQCRLYGIPI
ncbi:hypothetical protein BGZ98_005005 [Dissophora globulifera]|nr:hypothetical protein BGZ98_005005 [Dissophora globulifera]